MLQPDQIVDQFRVLRLIGRGGMGEVYLARDTVLGRKIALKVINAAHLGSRKSIQRFLFEARTTAQFNHPHIVTVFAAGEHRGNPYIALEYLEGQHLRQRMRERWPSLRESLRFGRAIADALQEAHRHNILHRDLKPENVQLPRDGRLRVVDFGLAKTIGEGALLSVDEPTVANRRQSGGAQSDSLDDQDTIDESEVASPAKAGGERLIVGTPAYIAPEQWAQLDTTAASDIWALGVVLFELIAGRRPYTDKDSAPLAFKVTAPEPAPYLGDFVDVPRGVSDLVHHCLEKDPRQRPTAAEIQERLEQMISRRRHVEGDERSPFRGLLPFGERHADFFFGRDAEIGSFLERLREQPVLPVVGPSGAGKSSFVQAGVLPRLREQGAWLVLTLRPGSQPFATLAQRLISGEGNAWHSTALDMASADLPPQQRDSSSSSSIKLRAALPVVDERALAQQLTSSPQKLSLILQRIADETHSRVLLFVDQLEELVTLVDDERQRLRFMQAIARAADDPKGPVRVVFTLRDDFLGRLAVGPVVRECLSHLTVLRSPPPQMLQEVLLRPLQVTGYEFDDASLIGEMVASVQDEPACLPLLQFALKTLWERRDRQRHLLRRSHYEAMGGVGGALAEHADGVLAGLSSEQIDLARQILLRLVSAESTRLVLTRAAVLEGLPEGAAEVLDRFTGARLISTRKGGRDEEQDLTLELVHESLIRTWKRLARWIDESRDELGFLQEVGQAAELWDKRGRKDEEAWRGSALRDALRARRRCGAPVPPRVDDFLAAGQRLSRRAQRRRRMGVASLGLVAVIAAAMALAFFEQKNTARRQSAQLRVQWAESQREGARAALARENLLEARAKVRGSLETQDSALGRALWWQLSLNPLLWKSNLGTGIYDVSFHPGRRELSVACQDRTIHLFDVDTGNERLLRGHDDQVIALAYNPVRPLLASAGGDGQIRLWQLSTGGVRVLQGHDQPVWGLAFSHDGTRLASAGWDGSVRLWDVAKGVQLRSLAGHREGVWSVEFSPDDRQLLSASADKTLRLWTVQGPRSGQSRVLKGHRSGVAAGHFSHDGARIVSAGYDREVRLWSRTKGRTIRILRGSGDRVRDAIFSRDDREVIAVGSDNQVHIWDAASGQLVRSLEGHQGAIGTLSLSSDGQLIATGSSDKTIRLWRLAARDRAPRPIGHESGTYAVAFAPDGQTLASSSYDRSIRLWSVRSGQQLGVLRGHSDTIFGLAFSPDGRLLASSSYDKSVRLWSMETLSQVRILRGHTAMVDGVAFSPDGALLASGGSDKVVRLWDVATGTAAGVLRGHESWVTGVDFSPDGHLLASTGYDQTIRIWDLDSLSSVQVLRGHKAEIYDVAFGPEGQRLISGSGDRSVRLWDLRRGSSRVLGHHDSRVLRVDFAPDGTRVASSSADQTVRIWPLDGSRPLILRGHRAETNSVAFSPHGRRLASTGDDGTLRLWDARTGRPAWRGPALLRSVAQFNNHMGWHKLDAQASSVDHAWARAIEQRARLVSENADASLLCLLGDEGTVEMWDRRTDQRVLEHRVGQVERIVALPGGCALTTPRQTQILDRQGVTADIPLVASAIAQSEGDVIVAAGQKVFVFGADGNPKASYDAGIGVTALLRTPSLVILGFRDGSLELVARDAGAKKSPSFAFADTPSSEVSRIIEGPQGTLIIGFASGAYGIWNLSNGSQLYRSRIHGPVRHLLIRGSTLHVASTLGSYQSLDLSIFTQPYCSLLRSIWAQVPIVWFGGLPLVSLPSPEHRCFQAVAPPKSHRDP